MWFHAGHIIGKAPLSISDETLMQTSSYAPGCQSRQLDNWQAVQKLAGVSDH